MKSYFKALLLIGLSFFCLTNSLKAFNQAAIPNLAKLNKILVLNLDFSKLGKGSTFSFNFFTVENKLFPVTANKQFFLLVDFEAVQKEMLEKKDVSELEEIKAFTGYKNLTVVIYPNLRKSIPEAKSERNKIASFFGGLPLVFDDEENLVFEASESEGLSQVLINGLYFVQDKKIQVRYLMFGMGSFSGQGILDDIQGQMKRFNNNFSIELFPFEVGRTGSVIPTSVIKPNRVTVVFRVSLRKGEVKKFEKINSINQNILLERLPVLLAAYPVQFVGLVYFDKSLISELEKAYPKWNFISMTTNEERIKWFEITAAVLDEKNVVVGHYGLFMNEQMDNFDKFADAVKQALK